MANIAKSLEKIVKTAGNSVNTAKRAADKVLWGSVNDTPTVPAAATPAKQIQTTDPQQLSQTPATVNTTTDPNESTNTQPVTVVSAIASETAETAAAATQNTNASAATPATDPNIAGTANTTGITSAANTEAVAPTALPIATTANTVATQPASPVATGTNQAINTTTQPSTQNQPAPKKPKQGSLLETGLFNALDALLTVDLCNVLTYLYSNVKGPKRKPYNEASDAERLLYDFQDKVALVREAIDIFYATPNEIIVSLKSSAEPAAPAPETIPTPEEVVGTAIKKYNLGKVGKYISQTLRVTANVTQTAQQLAGGVTQTVQSSFLDDETMRALSIVPGFKANINVLQDFINTIEQYEDFRNIPNREFQTLLDRLDTIRSVCVTIENLNLNSAVELIGQFTGTDIRSEISKLNQYLNPKKLIPTLKDINTALQSFIKVCNTIQAAIKTTKGTIKVCLTLIKVFKFVYEVAKSIPAPLQFATYNMVARLEDAKEKAKENTTGLEKFLEQLNALIAISLNVVRYLQQNAEALITRMNILISILEGCDSMANSQVLTQLKSTNGSLSSVNKSLVDLLQAATPQNPNTFGTYSIRIDQEQLADPAIRTGRRRGLAIDQNGVVVTQSDLTFATSDAVIIQEVKVKLVSLGLVDPSMLSETDAVILEALSYLGQDGVNMNDLNLPPGEAGAESLGLQDYLAGLPGADSFRKRARRKLKETSDRVRKAIINQTNSAAATSTVVNRRP